MLDMVDSGKIAFRPAVELSYLSKEQQQSLYDAMECEDCTPLLAQAIKMKEFSRDGKLSAEVILSHYAGGKIGTSVSSSKCRKSVSANILLRGRPHRKLRYHHQGIGIVPQAGAPMGMDGSHYQG